MNATLLFIHFLNFFLIATPASQNKPNFEGTITYTRTVEHNDGKTSEKTILYWLKENQLRVDYFFNNSLTITRIVDANSREIKVLVNDNLEKKASVAKFIPLNQTNIGKINTEIDTASKTILGYSCQKINFSHGELKATLWVANSIPLDYNTLLGAIVQTSEGYLPQGLLGLPLQTTITDPAKQQTITIKASQIVAQKLTNDVFEIPNDYQINIIK